MTRQILWIRDNLAGAWAIMLGRPAGLHRLDLTLAGFWCSFAGIVALVPFGGLELLSERRMMLEASGTPAVLTGADVVAQAVALLADWITFPLVFALLARPLGLGARYVPFIVTRNWASVIVAALMSVVDLVHVLGALPSVVASILLFAAFAVALRFSYVITRMTLGVPMSVALPIVLVDFLISLTIWTAAGRLA